MTKTNKDDYTQFPEFGIFVQDLVALAPCLIEKQNGGVPDQDIPHHACGFWLLCADLEA